MQRGAAPEGVDSGPFLLGGLPAHLLEALGTFGEEGNPAFWKRAVVLGICLNLGLT